MGASINIDIGGTFTDSFVCRDGRLAKGKAPTTHYDLSVGFVKSLERACEGLDISIDDLFRETEVLRYATTIATNALIEKSGPKLGLMTTAGFEDTILVGRARQWADGRRLESRVHLARIRKPEPLIPRSMIVGLRERVDCTGDVVIPLKDEEVREALDALVNRGAMGIVVSLLWSFLNPTHEKRVREIIRAEYPDVVLGSIPVYLSHEISPLRGEYPRTMTTIVNAYTHRELCEQLGGLRERLMAQGFRRPIMMVTNCGGMTDLTRTSALGTYNSGPAAGLLGSRNLARLYGIRDVVVTDMGGTSFDFGLLVGGEARLYDLVPTVESWRVQTTMLEIKTIGAGGGSIARVHPSLGVIEVGPQSAGSMPGPACYDMGGEDPTVTDADLVLGYLNPDRFLGGRVRLDRERAVEAIREKIAIPLGMDVVEAAASIRKIVDSVMGQTIQTEMAIQGHDAREFQMFAYGGAGPTHCCDYAETLGIDRIFTFPFAPVFCAFGASTLDVAHVYEFSRSIVLYEPQLQMTFGDYDEFNWPVANLRARAVRDMRGEGFREDQIVFRLELQLKYGTQRNTIVVPAPKPFVESEQDVREICEAFTREYLKLYSAASAYPQGGIELERMRLVASCPVAGFDLPRATPAGRSPARALLGTRDVYWREAQGFRGTPVYAYCGIECGNVVEGPAIIEAEDTTYVVPPGMRYECDPFRNGIVTREGTERS